ncbi:MAG: type II secretion system protein GspF, partial [Betaproteobacteria bacterium]
PHPMARRRGALPGLPQGMLALRCFNLCWGGQLRLVGGAALVEPLLIVGMGRIVVVIMLSVLLPIIQLRSWVGG